VSHRQGIRPARSCALAVALAAVALAIPAFADSAGASVPARFWGVAPQSLPSEALFQRLKRGGVDSLRFPIEWSSVESVEGLPDWGYDDSLVAGSVASGIEPLPFVTGAPSWAIRQVSVNRAAHSFAPRNLPVTGAQRSGWQRFLREAVGRYGPGGAFWSMHPELPYRPIRIWQIWNEANFKYFVARPNPAEYGKLVKLSYSTIRGVDPGARLILSGLYAEPKEATGRYRKMRPRPALLATEFLKRMYRSTPGIKRKFIGIALHPYSVYYRELGPEIERVRKVLRQLHDPGKGLWVTEVGWSSQPPEGRQNLFAKGRGGQVRELKGAFKLLLRNRVRWRLKRIYWFSVDDHPGNCNFCDGTGLFNEGFVPKPSWKAYVHFAGGTP
jgi:polysaccharide biosynthesis protein PslG